MALHSVESRTFTEGSLKCILVCCLYNPKDKNVRVYGLSLGLYGHFPFLSTFAAQA